MSSPGGTAPAAPKTPEWKAFLWVFAALLLLVNIGGSPLWGSEGRWAEIVREMFVTGDFLHPRINWEAYFDKPLLSYWFIAAFAWLKGGAVNELFARLPSAIAALAALYGTLAIGRKLWDEKTGYRAAWILLTAYSFAFWGRTAAADMENVAFTILAVAWYIHRRERTDYLSYAVFWAICALGGQTKGLGAVALPPIIAGIDMLLSGSWRKHLNASAALAAATGAFIYFVPFLLEKATRTGDYASSGLGLVFRENVVRFFNPFDHNEPWYVYFIYVPQLFLPWTPLLALAAFWAAKERKSLGHAERWLCLSALATFAIFTASGSRRVYYILPLLPFCALLCAAYLKTDPDGPLRKAKEILLLIMEKLALSLGFGAIALSIFWKQLLAKLGYELPISVEPFLLLAGSGVLFTIYALRISAAKRPENADRVMSLALSVCFALIMLFGFILNEVFKLRTEKGFCKRISPIVATAGPDDVAFYPKTPTDTAFYLARASGIPVLKTPEDVAAFLAKKRSGTAVLIGERRYLDALPPQIKESVAWIPGDEETCFPWEKKNAKKKLVAKFLAPSLPPAVEVKGD